MLHLNKSGCDMLPLHLQPHVQHDPVRGLGQQGKVQRMSGLEHEAGWCKPVATIVGMQRSTVDLAWVLGLMLELGLWCQEHTQEQRTLPLDCNNHGTQDILANQQVHTTHRQCSRQKVQHD